MVLKNSKLSKKGFTIVELLVVIVVIGILAAITVVSYTGVTTKANTATNQSNANSVVKSLQAHYADNNTWPVFGASSAATITAINTNNVATLPTSIVLGNATATAGSTIGYVNKGTTVGVCVSYWDYNKSGGAGPVYITTGTATCP